MKALIALPVRSTDYWHEDAIVIAGDARMQEDIDAVGSSRVSELITIDAWPSYPDQPTLLVCEVDADGSGRCRLLTDAEWELVRAGRVEEMFK